MVLVPDSNVADTILSWLEEERPVFSSIIDRYFSGRQLNLFLGRRSVIPASSLPSIEVQVTDVSLSWFACRVQTEEPSVEIDISTDNGMPSEAVRLESELVTLVTRILASPIHLRPRILRTRNHFYDALPSGVTYAKTPDGRMRVAVVSWKGKSIEFLANRLFEPYQIPSPAGYPIIE